MFLMDVADRNALVILYVIAADYYRDSVRIAVRSLSLFFFFELYEMQVLDYYSYIGIPKDSYT